MRIRNGELDADQAALDQASEKVGPERLGLGLGLADLDREDLAPAGLMNTMSDHQRLVATRPPSRTFSTLASRNRYG